MSLRLVRSPVAPKITIEHGSITRSRGIPSRNGFFCMRLTLYATIRGRLKRLDNLHARERSGMKRRCPRRPVPFYAVAAIVLGSLAAGVSPASPRGGDLVSDDGRSLWRLDADGVLARVE